MILSAAELASLWMPPTASVGTQVQRVKSLWLDAPAKAFIDPNDPENVVLGYGRRSDGTWAPIGIPYADFRYILHITAPMGRGKSEWLKTLFAGLMRNGAGFMALDCKGTDLVNDTIPLVPLHREKDVVILDLGGTRITGEDLRASMNLVSPAFGRGLGLDYSKLASTVLQIFATLDPKFNEAVGVKQFANMGMLALLEGEPRATLMHLIRFFGDEDYRADVCSRVNNIQVKDFWERRFEAMPESQKSSLSAFERRLDQMLTYPELSAMLVAPGCSIDLRRLMDTNGILLAGIKATEGQIASIAGTLLLTQMTIAALSRSNIPVNQRAHWPVVIDEAQIVFTANPAMATVMFSQLRAFHIGSIIVHQNLEQLAAVMGVLGGNTQNRVILGSELDDAASYASKYGPLGLSTSDFVNMPNFKQQYIKLYQRGELFASRPLPMEKPIDEPAPEVVKENWQTIKAHARNAQEQKIDDAIARFRELARIRPTEAVQRLGQLSDAVFDAYCARTKAHREAQRAFIIENPGCIPLDSSLGDKARIQQKEQRIRILSALGAGVPRLETEAMQWKLLMAARDASERRAAAQAAEKAAKKGGRGSSSSKQASARVVAPSMVPAATGDTTSLSPNAETRLLDEAGQPMPTIEQLLAERGARRAADDIADGFDAFED
jgi:hypothetical protein